MSWTRRDILRTGATAAATALLSPAALLGGPRAARAAGADPVLVLLLLRGGADGLSLVPPVGDDRYYTLRRELAIARRQALDLDGFFGLHPALQPLRKHYRNGTLAVVHAFGSPHPTRSHFDAQDNLESGIPGNRKVTTGWLGRYAKLAGLAQPWSALTLGSRPTRALSGASASLVFESLSRFMMPSDWRPHRAPVFERIARATGGAWGKTARNALAALEEVTEARSEPRVAWPGTPLGNALRDLAILIRSRIGVRVAVVDMAGGWDHHVDLARHLPESAAMLAGALDAFVAELGSEFGRTVVLVMTEFGRSAVANGSGGAEHGRGGAMFALGGPVAGGRVLLGGGRWPGLGPAQLVDGRDLAVTTDYRDLCAEVLRRHMGVPLGDLASIFPGHEISAGRFPDLIG